MPILIPPLNFSTYKFLIHNKNAVTMKRTSTPTLIKTVFVLFTLLAIILPNQGIAASMFVMDGGTIEDSQTIAPGDMPNDLVELTPPSFTGPYEYLWMRSVPSGTGPNGSSWVEIPGSNTEDFTFTSGVNVTTLYMRCVRLVGTLDYVESNQVAIVVDITLPIELSAFKARDNKDGTVQILWSTSSELDNEYFVVEKSADGVDFKTLGRVEGALTSTLTNHYDMVDVLPNIGENYYRLKQVDTNGDFEYSDIISIRMRSGVKTISFFPNPVIRDLNIKINAETEEASIVEIINMNGQIINRFETDDTTEAIYPIDLETLPTGTYFLSVKRGNEQLMIDRFQKM